MGGTLSRRPWVTYVKVLEWSSEKRMFCINCDPNSINMIRLLSLSLSLLLICIEASAQDFTYSITDFDDCAVKNTFFAKDEPWDEVVEKVEGRSVYLELEDAQYNYETLKSAFTDDGVSFKLSNSVRSLVNPDFKYRHFQQYYMDVLIEGGGYIDVVPAIADIPDDEDDDDEDCLYAVVVYPNVLSGIDIDAHPNVSSSQLSGLLDTEEHDIASAVLRINYNNYVNCGYKLVWQVRYANETRQATIDAVNGDILADRSTTSELMAPTINYGMRDMQDATSGSSLLATVDSYHTATATENRSGMSCASNNSDNNLIPTTSQSSWSTAEAPLAIYQAHFVTIESAEQYRNLFGSVGEFDKRFRVFGGCTIANATVTDQSSQYLVKYGTSASGGTFALIDIAAHEIGHAFLDKYFSAQSAGSAALHEAITDMLGVYIEHNFNGNPDQIDWVLGNGGATDIPQVDISNPTFNCVTADNYQSEDQTVENDDNLSEPFSHWFYRLVTITTDGEPSLDLPIAMNLVLDAVALLQGTDPTVEDFRNATMQIARQYYGLCSSKLDAVYTAWDEVCFAPDKGPCEIEVFIDGSAARVVCEEDNKLTLCPTPATNGVTRWTVVGPKSTEFVLAGNQQGNVVENNGCLYITSFPQFSSYPVTFKVRLRHPQTADSDEVTITLVDCDGDDGCDYTEGLVSAGSSSNSANMLYWNEVVTQENIAIIDNSEKFDILIIYDLHGRVVTRISGSNAESNMREWMQQNNSSSIYLFSKYLSDGSLVSSQKIIITR